MSLLNLSSRRPFLVWGVSAVAPTSSDINTLKPQSPPLWPFGRRLDELKFALEPIWSRSKFWWRNREETDMRSKSRWDSKAPRAKSNTPSIKRRKQQQLRQLWQPDRLDFSINISRKRSNDDSSSSSGAWKWHQTRPESENKSSLANMFAVSWPSWTSLCGYDDHHRFHTNVAATAANRGVFVIRPNRRQTDVMQWFGTVFLSYE